MAGELICTDASMRRCMHTCMSLLTCMHICSPRLVSSTTEETEVWFLVRICCLFAVKAQRDLGKSELGRDAGSCNIAETLKIHS